MIFKYRILLLEYWFAKAIDDGVSRCTRQDEFTHVLFSILLMDSRRRHVKRSVRTTSKTSAERHKANDEKKCTTQKQLGVRSIHYSIPPTLCNVGLNHPKLSASAMALSIALALLTVSVNSYCGTLSATMPPPACT